MGLHEYTPGFQFPRGFQPLNPIPVDSWSGPYANADGTTASAIQDALNTIPGNLRFLSMEVRILARTGPGGSTLAYKYWFRGNTGTLEEFSSGGGGGSTITNYVESFNGRTGAVQGVSAALPGDGIAVSAVTGSVTITNTGVTYISAGSFISVSGNTGTVTITNLGVHSFNGKTGAVTGASLGANTFTELNTFNAGISASGATLGTLTVNSGATVGGRLDVGSVLDVAGGVTLDSTLDVVGAARFAGGLSAARVYVSQGSTFIGPVTFAGITATRVDTGTLATTGQATLNSLSVTNNASVGGTLDVFGNLYVRGTVATINETQLLIEDKFLVLGSTTGTYDSSLANGAGLYIGATIGTNAIAGICYSHSGNQWSSSHAFNIPTNTSYRIGGVTAIAGTFLGSAIAGSSLTSVATLTNGVWNASVIGLTWGGTNKNLNGGLCGGIVYKDTTGLEVLSSVGVAGEYLKSNGSAAPSWASFSVLTGLTADRVKTTATNASGTYYLTFVTGAANSTDLYVDTNTGITFDPATDTLSCVKIEAIVDGGTW